MPKISEEAKASKKKHTVEQAVGVFSKKGYTEASMDDIVEATGMSKGGIYNYFKSKEEIFLAIAADRFYKRHDMVRRFPESISSKERLTKYIEWVFNGLFDDNVMINVRFTFEFWSVASRKKEILEIAKERYQLFYDDLAEIIRQGIKKGEFDSKLDIDSMVYIILSSMDGIAFCAGVMGIPVTQGVIKSYLDMVFRKIIGGE